MAATLTADRLSARGRLAVLHRWRPSGHPDLVEARTALQVARAEAELRRLAAEGLRDEDRARLSAALAASAGVARG